MRICTSVFTFFLDYLRNTPAVFNHEQGILIFFSFSAMGLLNIYGKAKKLPDIFFYTHWNAIAPLTQILFFQVILTLLFQDQSDNFVNPLFPFTELLFLSQQSLFYPQGILFYTHLHAICALYSFHDWFLNVCTILFIHVLVDSCFGHRVIR